MRVAIRLIKAGKEGLVPVQKQVTKKGKTFTQTFYVKPETTPGAPSKPSAVDVLSPAPKGAKSHYNRDDGFYINFGTKFVKLPESALEYTFEYHGNTFVVGRIIRGKGYTQNEEYEILSGYRVWESKSGLSITSTQNNLYDPTEAVASAMAALESHDDETINNLVAKAKKPSDADSTSIVSDTDGIPIPKKIEKITGDDIRNMASEVLDEMFPNDDPDDRPINIDQFIDWITDKSSPKTTQALDMVRENLNDVGPETLEYAVNEYIQLSEAEYKIKALGEMLQNLASPDLDIINDWIRDYSGSDLSEGLDDVVDYGVYDNHAEEWYMEPWDVVEYAIAHDMSLTSAHDMFEDAAQSEMDYDDDDDDDDDNYVDFTDSGGNKWDYAAIYDLGTWVGGGVKSNREVAKDVFKSRAGLGDEGAFNTGVFDTVESHLQTIPKGTKLYRGTPNTTWLSLNPGDTMPLGMASFSYDEDISIDNFGGNKVLIILDNDEDGVDLPRGVDLNDVEDSGTDAGYERTIERVGLPQYHFEREVIVMAPNLEVISIDGNRIHARVTDMNLVNKSHTDPRLIALAERTFDRHMHDDIDDGYYDSEE